MSQHPGFNPRAQQNSNALSDFVLADFRRESPLIDAALASGKLREKKNAAVHTKVTNRNVDLILYTGDNSSTVSVHASVENKSIMAAHGKARKNRFGDLIAYSNHMHNHKRDCIAAGVLIVNISATYENPDPFAKGLRRAKFDMQKTVADTIALFAAMPLRDNSSGPSDQLEAITIIVVDYDGANPAKLVTDLPAPQTGDKIYYANFVKRIAEIYSNRFNRLTQRSG